MRALFQMMFSDGSPVMIASQESLDDLNEKYTDEDLTMDRFRPNLCVDRLLIFFLEQ